MDYSTPGFPVLHHLLEFAQTHVHWFGDAIQPSHPLPSPSPAFNLSSIRVFSNELALHSRWPKYWSFSFSISPSNEYSGLISFRIDWFDLLAVQGTLKSLLQHHNSKASIPHCSALFMVQLSYLYMTTGKTRALMMQTCVREVTSLLFNTLSRFVIAFLPRSKRVLISWLQSLSSVILEPKKIKSVIVFTFYTPTRVLFSELISRFLNWCKCPWNASLTRAAGAEPWCGAYKPRFLHHLSRPCKLAPRRTGHGWLRAILVFMRFCGSSWSRLEATAEFWVWDLRTQSYTSGHLLTAGLHLVLPPL